MYIIKLFGLVHLYAPKVFFGIQSPMVAYEKYMDHRWAMFQRNLYLEKFSSTLNNTDSQPKTYIL